MCSLCLVFGVTGSDPEANTALRAEGTDTGFLGNGETRTLHRRGPSVLSTLDADCWLEGQRSNFGTPPPSCPSSTAPFGEVGGRWGGGREVQEGEKRTDTLETAECVQCRLAQGHKLLWTLLPITAQQPC